MKPNDILYTQISLASESPLNAVEAFDEAVGYRTDAQCAAISRFLQNSNYAAAGMILMELFSAAILRNEELADAERDNATERADAAYTAFKDAYPMPAFPSILKTQVTL